jgi:fatty acid desaturase
MGKMPKNQLGGVVEHIEDRELRGEAWKYYFVAVAWLVYLFVLPWVQDRGGAAVLLCMIFPGIWLYTWMAYLMHECWHKYVPNVPNDVFYNIFSCMMITDPQLYRIVHGWHHSQVNTYDDIEFHPLGEIKTRFLRAVYNFFEIMLGALWLLILGSIVLPRHPKFREKYRFWKLGLAVIVWVLHLGAIGFLSHLVFGVDGKMIAVLYVLTLYIGSAALHHAQMIEHGNLIVEGDLHQRDVASRNLRPVGLMAKIWLFLTHNDSREHVLHHTLAKVHSRPFPGRIPLPEEAAFITLEDYRHIIGDMLRGRDSKV